MIASNRHHVETSSKVMSPSMGPSLKCELAWTPWTVAKAKMGMRNSRQDAQFQAVGY